MTRALWCALLLIAGCGDPAPTEVVVVLQSDLSIPADTDGTLISVVAGPYAPDPNSPEGINTSAVLLEGFPISAKFSAGQTTGFSMTVELLGNLTTGTVMPSIVVRRTVTDIRFSPQRTMMLPLPMLRRCACQGTTCPAPGDPDCDNIDLPTLQAFDPAVAPASSFGTLPAIEIPPPATGNH
jgi:hypothetical protein